MEHASIGTFLLGTYGHPHVAGPAQVRNGMLYLPPSVSPPPPAPCPLGLGPIAYQLVPHDTTPHHAMPIFLGPCPMTDSGPQFALLLGPATNPVPGRSQPRASAGEAGSSVTAFRQPLSAGQYRCGAALAPSGEQSTSCVQY